MIGSCEIGEIRNKLEKTWYSSYNKTFLGENNSEGGSVHWWVEGFYDESGPYTTGEFNISDCYRSICLSFSFDDDEGFEERVGKVDTFINELTKLKLSLIESNRQSARIYQQDRLKKEKEDVSSSDDNPCNDCPCSCHVASDE